MSHITRYDRMPIPPVEEHTAYFEAGDITLGVEYRLLTDAIAAASELEQAGGGERGQVIELHDRGVSIHVFVRQDGKLLEQLRFDCFDEDPHYHYVSWKDRSNEMLHLDPVADGDPLAWTLERIRTRLPQMLERAGAADAARRVDTRALEAVLPLVAERAYRVRFDHDDAALLRGALSKGGRA